MKNRIALELSFAKRAALAVAAIAALAVPLAVGVLNAPALQAQSSAPRFQRRLRPLGAMAQAATTPGRPSSQKPLTFDVASVKSTTVPEGVTLADMDRRNTRKGSGVQVPRNTGGPGTDDPGRIHYPLITLKELLNRGWNSYYEIDGPGWLDTQVVAVEATMPPATTKEQFQEMLRNLVTERFGLKYHTATREIAGYALGLARNGPKMKESADQSEAEYARPGRPTGSDKDGFPIYPPVAGKMMMSNTTGDRSRIIGQQIAVAALARMLGSELKTIVTDTTGLKAKYDFTLTYEALQPAPPPAHTPEALEPLPDIFGALQSQLGLKLEAKKVPVEVFVVDRMEKTPTGNQ